MTDQDEQGANSTHFTHELEIAQECCIESVGYNLHELLVAECLETPLWIL